MTITVEGPDGIEPPQWMLDRSARPCKFCPADVFFFYKGGSVDSRDSWHIACVHDAACPGVVNLENWAN